MRLQQASHVLDTEDVDAFSNELVDEAEIVFQSVLGLLGISDVTTVAHDSFANTSSLLGGVNTELHLWKMLATNEGEALLTQTHVL